LSDESRVWVESGIIPETARDAIMSGYAVARNLPMIVTTLGVVMVGIGVLSFIAANWDVIPPYFKVAIVVGAYILSVATAFLLEKRGRRTYSDILLLLSGFLSLGGLALIAQIFYLDGSVTGLLGTWLIIYAPTFFLVRNISVYALYEVVAIAYACIAYYDYEARWLYDHVGELVLGPFVPFLLMVVLVGWAWRCWYEESRVSLPGSSSVLRYLFVGGSTRRIVFSNFYILIWFTGMCVINSRHESFLPFIFGVLLIGTVFNAIAWKLDASDIDWQALTVISAAGFALTFPLIWYDSGSAYYYSYRHAFTSNTIISAVALGAYLIYRIIKRQKGSGFSVFWFCVLLSRWYFDMFFDFMDKSLFFITGGVVLVAVAYAYRKWNRVARGVSPVPVTSGEPGAKDGDSDE
jgi:uncharacterized membrane protein